MSTRTSTQYRIETRKGNRWVYLPFTHSTATDDRPMIIEHLKRAQHDSPQFRFRVVKRTVEIRATEWEPSL